MLNFDIERKYKKTIPKAHHYLRIPDEIVRIYTV